MEGIYCFVLTTSQNFSCLPCIEKQVALPRAGIKPDRCSLSGPTEGGWAGNFIIKVYVRGWGEEKETNLKSRKKRKRKPGGETASSSCEKPRWLLRNFRGIKPFPSYILCVCGGGGFAFNALIQIGGTMGVGRDVDTLPERGIAIAFC